MVAVTKLRGLVFSGALVFLRLIGVATRATSAGNALLAVVPLTRSTAYCIALISFSAARASTASSTRHPSAKSAPSSLIVYVAASAVPA